MEERGVNREEKARVIEELAEKLKDNSVVLVDYQGMNVAQSTRLRARSRESGVEFVVAKNTLARDAAGVLELSRLPGREQLIAQVVGGIQSPIAGLVNVLNGTIRNLAVVLNAVAEQKKAQA